jgi:hypothetical protein
MDFYHGSVPEIESFQNTLVMAEIFSEKKPDSIAVTKITPNKTRAKL